MKKVLTFLSLVLALTLLCPCVPAYAADAKSGECGADVRWTLAADGTLTVSGAGEMISYLFDEDRPYNSAKIKRVVVEPGVTAIGSRAFAGGKNITSVKLADSVTKIGQFAFQGAAKLKEVELPASLTAIGYCAFDGCAGLKKIAVPEGVLSLDTDAFRNCAALADITLPDSVETIGSGVFEGTALYNDPAAREDGVLYIGKHLIAADPSVIPEKLTVKPGTLTIADSALVNAGGLVEVVLPEGLKYYGNFSFLGSGLKTLKIPAGARIIGSQAFGDSADLATIELPDGVEDIYYGAFYNTAYVADPNNEADGLVYCGKYLIAAVRNKLPEACRIREGTELIARSVFMGAEMIKSIELPASMRNVGNSLYGINPDICCIALESITVDGANGVYSSQDGVLFSKDRSELILYPAAKEAEEYTVPSGVKRIGDWAFRAASALKRVTIPAGVTSIGEYVFNSSESVESVSVAEGVREIGRDAFSNCWSLKKLSLPGSLESVGEHLCGGSRHLEEIEFGGSAQQWERLTSGKDTVTYTEKEVVYSFGADTPEDPSDGNEGLLKVSDNTRVRVDNANKTVTALPYVTIGEFRELLIDPPETVGVRGWKELPGDSRWLHTGDHIEASDEDDAAVYSVIVLFDVNCDGKVSSADARLALRAAAKVETLNDAQLRAATRGASDKVTAGDARSILRVGARLETVSF